MKAVIKLDNKKRVTYKSAHDRYLFILKLAKNWVVANPNTYFHIDKPVGISVTLYDKQKSDNYYNMQDYDLGGFIKLLTEGLENVAYDKKRQIVEISVSKFYDKEQRVEFEVYEA